MLSFQEFLAKFNGQNNVGNTPENKGQCVGLVAVWFDNLGLAHVWGDAKDLYANADPKFYIKIPNTPDAIPQKGDAVVWSAKYNGTVGHTGLATGTGNLNTFEAFEQNDPTGSNCHLRTYNYNAVIGWLRPINEPMATISQRALDEIIRMRNNHWDNLQIANNHITELELRLQQSSAQIKPLQTKIANGIKALS